jgi:large subunit ribosomal protein L17
MRHHNANRKLGRKAGPRRALLKSLARSLALEEKIKTTEAKAKELRPYFEKLVTMGKKQTIAARRLIEAKVGPEAAKKIVVDISPAHKERPGGYTRITKMVRRQSDGAPMAVIELVK